MVKVKGDNGGAREEVATMVVEGQAAGVVVVVAAPATLLALSCPTGRAYRAATASLPSPSNPAVPPIISAMGSACAQQATT